MSTFEGTRWAVIAVVTYAAFAVAIVVALLLFTTVDARKMPGLGLFSGRGPCCLG